MKKTELELLSKDQLIKKCMAYYFNYTKIRKRYLTLKADIILIKRQLENIAGNIIYNKDRRFDRLVYYKGGTSKKLNYGR